MSGSVGSGRLTTSTGRYRVFPIVGSGLSVVGMYLLSLMHAETPHLVSSTYMLILGLGVGMVLQVSLLAVQNGVEHRDLGIATSSAQFFRSMGGAFGVAIFGAIMNARLLVELPVRIPTEALTGISEDVTTLLNSPAEIRALPVEVAAGIAGSLEVAIQSVFFWAVPLMVVAFVLSWWLDEIPLRETVGAALPVDGIE